MEAEFKVEGRSYKVSIEKQQDKFVMLIDGNRFEIDPVFLSENRLSFVVAGEVVTIYVADGLDGKYVWLGREQVVVEKASRESVRKKVDIKASGQIQAPMPGIVKHVKVKEGDLVEAGQSLFTVEAMKMENDVKSPVKGVVKKLNLVEGQLVEAFKTVIEIEPS